MIELISFLIYIWYRTIDFVDKLSPSIDRLNNSKHKILVSFINFYWRLNEKTKDILNKKYDLKLYNANIPLNDVAYQQYSRVNPTTLGNVFIRKNFYGTMIQIIYSEEKKLLLRWDRWWNKEWVRVSIQLVNFML
jgi:hypothetical protein